MPIHGYPGNVITATPPSITPSGASGVFTTEDQLQYQTAGNWPMAATQISRSLRFNSADSAYLNRTPASASNQKTWTWSGWVKRSAFGQKQLFTAGAGTAGSPECYIDFEDNFNFQIFDGTSNLAVVRSSAVYRDPSAWYHAVVAVDTTQATASNRVLMYINGQQITSFTLSTYPSQNLNTQVNATTAHRISSSTRVNSYYFDGYLTEINFIDGYALTPASFGFNDSNTGIWTPRQYTGPYGTNGFYLNFSDNSGTTSTTLGKDYSGNGNNWTPNNFSVTAGVGNDSLVDTPTSYGTDTGVGGEVRGNYATLNPLNANKAPTNGNLDLAGTASGGYHNAPSTIAMTTGKWYWEVTCTAYSGDGILIGVSTDAYNYLAAASGSNYIGSTSTSWSYYGNNGYKYNNLSGSSYGSTFTTNDVIGIALDLDNGAIYFSKNGTWQNSGVPTSGASKTGAAYTTGLTGSTYYAGVSVGNNNSIVTNFGQRPFAYTAPSGFKALCTQNLPTPTIGATSTTQAGKYFNTVLYTGTGSSNSVTGVGFQPDLVWIKSRSNAQDHKLTDAVRGTTKALISDTTGAETTDTNGLTAFGSDGFTVGTDATYNTNTYTYVGWNWKANGSGSSNTAGTITSTVSANTTSGFSIVTYTDAGSSGTVGHGLGVKPSLVIVKSRTSTSNGNWYVLTDLIDGSYDYLQLNTTAAKADSSLSAATSTVFSVTQISGDSVAYCFAAVAGYSAFGSYTGNGSTDGPFVYTGFRPRYVMLKASSSAGYSWQIQDTARDTYNQTQYTLRADSSAAELTTVENLDILSNGFKLRSTNANCNSSGVTYIYAAFAESPFKYALAR